MLRTLSRVLSIALVVAAMGLAEPLAQAPQTATVDPQLIQRFATATTDEARASLLAANPVLGEPSGRIALAQFGTDMATARRFDVAEQAYFTMQWLGDQNKLVTTRSGALIGLGMVEGRRGNLRKSLELTEQGLAMIEASGGIDDQVAPLINLAIGYRQSGDVDRAIELSARALKILKAQAPSPRNKLQLAHLYNNVGVMLLNQGDLTRAREYLELSLSLKMDAGQADTPELAGGWMNLGALYSTVGDYQQALPHYERAVELYERLGLADAALTARNNIAQAQVALGLLADADVTLAGTERRAEAVGDKSAHAQALYLRGLSSRNSGNLAEAITFHQRSLQIRKAMGKIASLAESHAELSRLMLRAGRLNDAETEARQAISLASGPRLLNTLGSAQLFLAHVLEAQGRMAEAQAEFESAILTTEQMRDLALAGERSRQEFMRERIGPYAGLSALHSRAGRGWDALRVVEQARARTLLDLVAFGRPTSAGLSDVERQRERALTSDLMKTTSLVNQALSRTPQDPDEIAAREIARDRARIAHQAFKDDLYAAHPRLRLSRGEAPVLTKSGLDSVVPPGTVALAFMVNSDHVWLYAAVGSERGTQVTSHRLQMPPDTLMALAKRFSQQVSSRDLAFAATSRELYAALFSGVDTQLSAARRLIIVPDGALWSVPFQALTTPRDRYLIEERAVSYAPSLSSLVALRARATERPDRAQTFVALGDPATTAVANTEVRGVVAGPLPEARREVESLGRLYGATRSTVLVGADANEAALRKVVSGARVLHIASHGVFDNRSPMFSHLRLSAGTTDAPTGDGRLEAWELADLDLSADLVVLSACSTIGGVVGGGEGVMGLSWGLLAAGASTAVLSQWEVDSSSTTSLMLAFHQQRLKRDESVDAAPAALRAAAMTMLKDPKYRHPFYWAGFIVLGS